MKRINATKGGRRCSFRIDQLSDVRLLWALRVSREFLEVKASPATLIRRALAVYSHHLETLLEALPGDMRVAAEKVYLRKANRDTGSDITEQDVLMGPLRSLHQMQQSKQARKPKLIDMLKEDLIKWGASSPAERDDMPE